MLEPQVAAHAPEMFEVLADPAIYAHENEPPPSLDWLTARFRRLESRQSPDGREQWLNWVVRLPSGELAGYVQATVGRASHEATIAYVLASRLWGRGIAHEAVNSMLDILVREHGVRTLRAVLKATNSRSERLLRRLGFDNAPGPADPGEMVMRRDAIAIMPLDITAAPIAAQVHAIHMAGYAQEARLLGVADFPPLRRTVTDLQAGDESFTGAFAGSLAGVIGLAVDDEGAGITIASLVVAPDFQRRGVARRLVGHVVALHGRAGLTVQTGAGNHPALALYTSAGFVEMRRWSHAGPEPLELVRLRRPPTTTRAG